VVECNAWTLAQERYNVKWVREKGVGVVLSNFRSVDAGVRELLGSLETYRANVSKIENRAVFEIPDILARLVGRATAP